MIPMPIVAVTDIARTVEFYRALGFTARHQGPHWAELRQGPAMIGLHTAPELPPAHPARSHFALVTREPLEAVLERLARAGVRVERGIADESFGRSILLVDPDGLPIQVSEYDESLFGAA